MKKYIFITIASALSLINTQCVPNNPVLDDLCLNKSYLWFSESCET